MRISKTGLGLSFATLSLTAAIASAEVLPGTNLEVFAESANTGAFGRSVTLRRLPVRDQNTNQLNYYDVTFQFSINAANEFVVEPVTQIDVTPALISSVSLRSGNYRDPVGNQYRLEGPSVSPGGFENYVLTSTVPAEGSSLSGLSVSVSTQPLSERFEGIAFYSGIPTIRQAWDGAENDGNIFGNYSIAVDDNSVNWDTSRNEELASLRAISPNQIDAAVWDDGIRYSTISLIRIEE